MANIRERNGVYSIRVSNGLNGSGGQIIRSRSWTPPAGLSKIQIDRQLAKVVSEFETEVFLGAHDSDIRNLNLRQYCDLFLKAKKKKITPATYILYESVIQKFIIPELGNKKIANIKPIDIRSFITTLENTVLDKEKSTATLSSATVRKYFVVLKSIFAHACDVDEVIQINPTTKVGKTSLPKLIQAETETFTEEEIGALLKLISSQKKETQAQYSLAVECHEVDVKFQKLLEISMFEILILLAIFTGCRRGEIVALEWQDIDLISATLRVKKSVSVVGGKILIKEPKTENSKRIISLDGALLTYLTDYKILQESFIREYESKGCVWEYKGFLFTQLRQTDARGKLLYPTSPSQMLTKFLIKHNLPHKKFHALRHTSATLLLASGVDVKTVGQRLGHTQISTTNRYIHAVTKADKEASVNMSKILKI